MKESDNVCNMPELLMVEVHKSKDTGKYYVNFIDHTGTTCNNDGYWTDHEIAENTLKQILQICYPEWDGETAPFRCENDNDGNCLLCTRSDCEKSWISSLEAIKQSFECEK